MPQVEAECGVAGSPNGARFESPGRQPWVRLGRNQKPQRGETGPSRIHNDGISPRWGW